MNESFVGFIRQLRDRYFPSLRVPSVLNPR